MITIDGSFGEGGGQILRTSLALSLVTGKPFRIEQIRANRRKPGLGNQHLTAVNAAVEVGRAEVSGNAIGSMTVTFAPMTVQPGQYHFAIGTAGSCLLVLQTVLPALLTAPEPSELILEGGTHNPLAPTFDFLTAAFLPILSRMGSAIAAKLDRPGFYPAGGGKCRFSINPVTQLRPITLLERGAICRHSVTALLSNLPQHIAERELQAIKLKLGWERRNLHIENVKNPVGPGNVLTAVIECAQITEVFTGFGERGVTSEKVAGRVAAEIQEYLDAEVPVGRHLADQLLIPMAMAGSGRFRTLSPSQHTTTNIAVIKQFLDIEIAANQCSDAIWDIAVNP